MATGSVPEAGNRADEKFFHVPVKNRYAERFRMVFQNSRVKRASVELLQRGTQGIHFRFREKDTRIRSNGLQRPAFGKRNDRSPRRLRLHRNNPEILNSRKNQSIRLCIKTAQILPYDAAGKRYPVAAEFRQTLLHRTVAGDYKTAVHFPARFQRKFGMFVINKLSDKQEISLFLKQSGLKKPDIGGRMNYNGLPSVNPADPFRDETAVGDEMIHRLRRT